MGQVAVGSVGSLGRVDREVTWNTLIGRYVLRELYDFIYFLLQSKQTLQTVHAVKFAAALESRLGILIEAKVNIVLSCLNSSY